jgi:hypothetical protein
VQQPKLPVSAQFPPVSTQSALRQMQGHIGSLQPHLPEVHSVGRRVSHESPTALPVPTGAEHAQVPPPQVLSVPHEIPADLGLHLCFLHRWHSGQGCAALHRAAAASGTAMLSSPMAARPTATRRDVREPITRVRASKRSASKEDVLSDRIRRWKLDARTAPSRHRQLCCHGAVYTYFAWRPAARSHAHRVGFPPMSRQGWCCGAGCHRPGRRRPTLEARALQDPLRRAIATRRGSCSWDVDHAGWVVTVHSPVELTVYGRILETAHAYPGSLACTVCGVYVGAHMSCRHAQP